MDSRNASEGTAPLRKTIPSKTDRAESADEASLSPSSAPKSKKRRTVQQIRESSDSQDASDGMQQGSMVQLSVLNAENISDPTEISSPMLCELAELPNLKKCWKAVIDHFLADIKAAGFDENVKVLAYLLKNLDYMPGSASAHQQEPWHSVDFDKSRDYKKWFDYVNAAIGQKGLPCIQVLLVPADDYEHEKPLLGRQEKQAFRSISGRVVLEDKQNAADVSGKIVGKTRAAAKKPEIQLFEDDSSEDEEIVDPRRRASGTISQKDAMAAIRELKEAKAENRQLKAKQVPDSDEVTRLKVENMALRVQVKELKDSAGGRFSLVNGQPKIKALDAQNMQLKFTIDGLRGELTDVRDELAGVKGQLGEVGEELADAKEDLIEADLLWKQAAGHMRRAAIDIEAGRNPSAGLAPGEAPYWKNIFLRMSELLMR